MGSAQLGANPCGAAPCSAADMTSVLARRERAFAGEGNRSRCRDIAISSVRPVL